MTAKSLGELANEYLRSYQKFRGSSLDDIEVNVRELERIWYSLDTADKFHVLERINHGLQTGNSRAQRPQYA